MMTCVSPQPVHRTILSQGQDPVAVGPVQPTAVPRFQAPPTAPATPVTTGPTLTRHMLHAPVSPAVSARVLSLVKSIISHNAPGELGVLLENRHIR